MADMNEVYDALRKANAAGDVESVGKLIAYINSQAAPLPAPAQAPSTLGREAGLAVRPLAQTVMTAGGLLPMVVDPLVNFFNLAAGTNAPTMTKATETNLRRMGFPEPRTAQERVVQDITGAGYGTAGVAKVAGQVAPMLPEMGRDVAQFFAQSPRAQTAAALTASTAGGMLREGGAPPALQLGGAMLAGMAAPGGPSLSTTQRAMNVPKALVQPFTQQGREVMVGNVLRNVATDPERAIANLQAARPTVPGVQLTTAAGARDPGLAGLEGPLRSATFDPSNLFGARLSANQQALFDAFQRTAGRPGSIPKAEAKRQHHSANA